MGVRNSTRRRRMEDRETGELGGPSGEGTSADRQEGSDEEWQHDHNRDLATVLSYLIRRYYETISALSCSSYLTWLTENIPVHVKKS